MGAKGWPRKDGRERVGAFALALEYWMPHAGYRVLKKRRNSSQMAIYNCFF
jgi:hypothetical protein